MSEWMDISTAPKDQTIIDLWCGGYNERLVNYYRVGKNEYMPLISGRSFVTTATHWMHRPKPPEESK